VNYSTYLANKSIGATLLGSTYTSPTTFFISLATSLNSQGDSYTEVPTATGYARQVCAFGVQSPLGTTKNSGAVTFTQATTTWGTITHMAIHDAASSGNMLYWGVLSTARAIATGDTFQIPTNNLTVQAY
jgi:hypothetical protein